jgi:hypothetical protein
MPQDDNDTILHQDAVEAVIEDVIEENVVPIIVLTQEEYDDLDPPDPSTLYMIVG